MTETLQTTIKALRAMDFSQDEIGRQAGVSQMTISRWEKEDPRRQDTVALGRLTTFLEKVRHAKEGG